MLSSPKVPYQLLIDEGKKYISTDDTNKSSSKNYLNPTYNNKSFS